MAIAPLPPNEEARLELLHKLHLLDSAPEPGFDRITQLAADMLDVPSAAVSLTDRNRQSFKSCLGLSSREMPRNQAFCAHAILADEPLIISDALLDPRFADNPLVQDEPYIRFYTGIPLMSSEGIPLGTFCVFDYKPRELSAKQLRILNGLAEMVRHELLSRELNQTARAVFVENQRLSEESESRFRATFEQAAVGIAVIDTDGRWLQVNQKLCNIVGYSAAELLLLKFQDITHPDDLGSDRNLIEKMFDGVMVNCALEKRYIHKNGQSVWVNLSLSLMRDEQYRPQQFICIVEDIDARKKTEFALRRLQQELEDRVEQRTTDLRSANELLRASQSRLQTIADNLPIQIAYIDADQHVCFVNQAHRSDTGLGREIALGKKLVEILSDNFYQFLRPHIEKALAGDRVIFESVTNVNRELVWSNVFIPEFNGGKVSGFFIMSQEITARKQHELLLHDRAMHDALTGLPNRAALMERLHAALRRTSRSGESLALFFLDLDGFKAVNDQYGHEAGDLVLKQFAKRLKESVRYSDFVARLAGDEFVILLEALPEESIADTIAVKILCAMRTPFPLQTNEAMLGTSIGLYVHDGACDIDPERMLAQADKAMYQAKHSGKNRLCKFESIS